MPAPRVTAQSIARSFRISNKRHLILTGSRGCGKSTMLRELLLLSGCSSVPGFITLAHPQSHVELQNRLTGETAVIGRFDPLCGGPQGNRMQPVQAGFLGAGIAALEQARTSSCPWAALDEIGYLESSCPEFQLAVLRLLDARPTLLVVRKQDTPFLSRLLRREDAAVFDLDEPVLPIGCVVMASGLGRRFGGNKLLADFGGQPLLHRVLQLTDTPLLATRVVVTRSAQVQALCTQAGVPVLLHSLPGRNDTVRLGLEYLLEQDPRLRGCVFALGDQPLLHPQTLETMLLAFTQQQRSPSGRDILRLCWQQQAGSPVLFGSAYFPALCTLPAGKGGSVIVRRNPAQVLDVPALTPQELADVDTPEHLARLRSYL